MSLSNAQEAFVIIRIGIDVGGVIIDRIKNDGADTSFIDGDFMRTTAVEGAFETIRMIVRRLGAENVFIISKCGPAIQEKTLLWLTGQQFYKSTGFLAENIHFCLKRPEKGPIAAGLGLTHFIDDRADVLEFMTEVPIRYLFGPQDEPYAGSVAMTPVLTWQDVLKQLML